MYCENASVTQCNLGSFLKVEWVLRKLSYATESFIFSEILKAKKYP